MIFIRKVTQDYLNRRIIKRSNFVSNKCFVLNIVKQVILILI